MSILHENHGALLLLDLAPDDPAAGAEALRALVVACRSAFPADPDTGPLTGSDWHWAGADIKAALAQLEVAHGTR